jgi:hypothetical protein
VIADGGNDLTDGGGHVVGSFKVHVVSAVDDDLFAVGGEQSKKTLR